MKYNLFPGTFQAWCVIFLYFKDLSLIFFLFKITPFLSLSSPISGSPHRVERHPSWKRRCPGATLRRPIGRKAASKSAFTCHVGQPPSAGPWDPRAFLWLTGCLGYHCPVACLCTDPTQLFRICFFLIQHPNAVSPCPQSGPVCLFLIPLHPVLSDHPLGARIMPS